VGGIDMAGSRLARSETGQRRGSIPARWGRSDICDGT